MKYGQAPLDLGIHQIETSQVNSKCLYLPIKIRDLDQVRIPEEFRDYLSLIDKVCKIENYNLSDKYVYLTVKNTPVKRGEYHKREGWHCDGFLTDDTNYIYSDCLPTIFNLGEFNITQEHKISMKQFNEQALDFNNISYAEKHLLKINPFIVHRSRKADKDYDRRIFVKISISEHKYNLQGNTHNDLFDYNWKMYSRELIRNHPIHKETDFINSKLN